MKYSLALLALPFLSTAAILPRAATVTTLPAHTGTLQLPTATRIPAGGSFDGKMRRIDTGVPCAADVELFDREIVFILGEGATLSNVIIGPAQKKGVHCLAKCTLINVWWSKTCHYGLSILSQKAGDKAIIKGGGAFGATGTNSINSNFGDTAKITKSVLKTVTNVCTTFKGTTIKSIQAVKIASGNDDKSCIYGSDVVSS
ncbi:hypothetical protein ACEPPN_005926 [Leptodophora sp. 'Broadleaf-Isolate-01']